MVNLKVLQFGALFFSDKSFIVFKVIIGSIFNMMYLYKIIVIVFGSFILSQPMLISPEDQSDLNYLHIPFKWSQVSNSTNYEIQVSTDLEFNSIIYSSFQPHLLELLTDGIDWDNQYYWRVRSYYGDGSFSDWSDIYTFATLSFPDGLIDLNTELYEPDLVYEGITILDQLWYGYIFAIDLSGKIIWFIDSNQSFDDGYQYKLGFTYFLDNGNILGYADGRDNNVPGRAFEMDINNNLVWQGPGSLEGIGVHHDVIRLSNGNTMALASQDMLLPIPDADWPIEVENIIWRGDRIIEWDQDGNEIWVWSCFDYFSQDDWDYNQIINSFGLGFYDWTHSNAIWYDELDNVVYLSVRYLNRVTKIDYNTRNVVWNMGENTSSGDAEVGNDLNFSMQHAVKVLENRNLMIYDNGNDNIPLLSRGLEISITETDSIPMAEIVWEYQLSDTVSSGKMSDCDRLPNGNSLLTSTHTSHLLEVSSDNQKVWEVLPYQEFSTYRGERKAGLYPQLFSVIQPNFIEINQEIIISVNSASPNLLYTVINKGYNDQTFSYSIEDDNGWFLSNGSIDVGSGEIQDILFSGEINSDESSNNIVFSIYPIDAPNLIETYAATIESYVSNGDVNLDNSIDIFDIVIIIDIILLNIDPTEYQINVSDVNFDGNIDINDIIEIIEYIL